MILLPMFMTETKQKYILQLLSILQKFVLISVYLMASVIGMFFNIGTNLKIRTSLLFLIWSLIDILKEIFNIKFFIGIFSVATLILASFIFFFNSHPVISYDKTVFTDHRNSFEIAAKTCIKYHKEDNNDYFWLFCVDDNVDGLICYKDDKQQYYSLTLEQQQAFITVKSVFRLDHNSLSYLYVNDNFVSFGILNGRASYVYSASNESNRQPNPAPPKNKLSRDQPRLKSCIRFITMNYCELL